MERKNVVNKKQLAAGAFALFFLIMAVCTVISRAAASMTIPQVDTGRVSEGKLNVHVEGKGIVETKEEKLIFLERGLRIEQAAKEGSMIKAGDVIVKYDITYLQEAIEKKQTEIKKLELALEEAKIQGQPQVRVLASESAARDLNLAEESLADARQKLEEALENAENEKVQAQQNLDEENGAAWEEWQKAEEEAEKLRNAGQEEEADALLEDAEAAYKQRSSDAQAAFEAAVSEADAGISQVQEAADAQETARSQAQNQYESARQEDAAAAENDKKTVQAGVYTQQAAQADIDTAKKELEKLQQVQEKKGEVTAQESGVLKSITAAPGGVTDDTSCVIIGCGGYRVKGYLLSEDLSKAEKDHKVRIAIPGQGKSLEKTITEIVLENSESAAGAFYADIKENEAVPGSEISYELDRQTEGSYKQIIPISALRKDSDGNFCLIAEPEDTILGTEYVAKRISVHVEAKDSSSAAVASNLSPEDLIITGSSKDISAGDKVRLRE